MGRGSCQSRWCVWGVRGWWNNVILILHITKISVCVGGWNFVIFILNNKNIWQHMLRTWYWLKLAFPALLYQKCSGVWKLHISTNFRNLRVRLHYAINVTSYAGEWYFCPQWKWKTHSYNIAAIYTLEVNIMNQGYGVFNRENPGRWLQPLIFEEDRKYLRRTRVRFSFPYLGSEF